MAGRERNSQGIFSPERRLTVEEFARALIQMDPVREGPDWYARESSSLICLDLILNQRVGVERATAAAVALHDHFTRPFRDSDSTISEVTNWPYHSICLRRPAKSLLNAVGKHFENGDSASSRISDLPSSIIGALASLERYYNRCNSFFDPVRGVEVTSEQISSLTPELVYEITRIRLPEANLQHQLYSAAKILEMRNETC